MSTISTASNKTGRAVDTGIPAILDPEIGLQELIEELGEELALAKLQAQLVIDFRAKVRGMLEATKDEKPVYTDEQIAEMDFTDWKPELRKRKTAADKAKELFAGMSKEEIAELLAQLGDDE